MLFTWPVSGFNVGWSLKYEPNQYISLQMSLADIGTHITQISALVYMLSNMFRYVK